MPTNGDGQEKSTKRRRVGGHGPDQLRANTALEVADEELGDGIGDPERGLPWPGRLCREHVALCDPTWCRIVNQWALMSGNRAVQQLKHHHNARIKQRGIAVGVLVAVARLRC